MEIPSVFFIWARREKVGLYFGNKICNLICQ